MIDRDEILDDINIYWLPDAAAGASAPGEREVLHELLLKATAGP